MLFAYDTECSLRAAVTLVNTAFATTADVDTWYAHHEYTGRRDRDAAELAALNALRPALRDLLTSDRDRAATLVNDLLAQAPASPRLVRHGDLDWHVHAIADNAPLAARVTVETAMAMIDLVRADEVSRLSQCTDDTCDNLVIDLTRNRSRRFCSTACANRNAVAAYRARAKKG
ncbi:CGNR zinc finger domain-containing protein [Winogradskya humida]|uniref:Zinc finger CGNR domain-containing protein n=1 Tax=Winogradskya humida TaxID=113566 RepID=A0ABQ4A1I8_9ACTN|nr:CGNR zinc finger domain-containing protein [Actinoplanes humidus]GIE24715.1 hypothetical protein Ahu01nite_078170 [Actinoplanes humidus]